VKPSDEHEHEHDHDQDHGRGAAAGRRVPGWLVLLALVLVISALGAGIWMNLR
jgi:hypothetical protein